MNPANYQFVPQTRLTGSQRLAIDNQQDPCLPKSRNTLYLILNFRENKSAKKWGAEKDKLWPTADALSEIIRWVADRQLPAPRQDMAQWKHFVNKTYEVDVQNGVRILKKRGTTGGYVVPRERIHDVLVEAHEAVGHGGRDAVYQWITRYYCRQGMTKAFCLAWSQMCTHPKCAKKAVKAAEDAAAKLPAATATHPAATTLAGAEAIAMPPQIPAVTPYVRDLLAGIDTPFPPRLAYDMPFDRFLHGTNNVENNAGPIRNQATVAVPATGLAMAGSGELWPLASSTNSGVTISDEELFNLFTMDPAADGSGTDSATDQSMGTG